jgi:hypothetical protein
LRHNLVGVQFTDLISSHFLFPFPPTISDQTSIFLSFPTFPAGRCMPFQNGDPPLIDVVSHDKQEFIAIHDIVPDRFEPSPLRRAMCPHLSINPPHSRAILPSLPACLSPPPLLHDSSDHCSPQTPSGAHMIHAEGRTAPHWPSLHSDSPRRPLRRPLLDPRLPKRVRRRQETDVYVGLAIEFATRRRREIRRICDHPDVRRLFPVCSGELIRPTRVFGLANFGGLSREAGDSGGSL